MKKIIYTASAACALLFAGMAASNAQPIHDRAVVPVAVTLNQVMRLTIQEGGNIEFVFNTIDDYKNGLSGNSATSVSANPATSGPGNAASAAAAQSNDNFYNTFFSVSSSMRWHLTYGAEEATFIGNDDATNTFALNNVGFFLNEFGAHAFGTELTSPPTTGGTVVADLDAYPVILIDDNGGATANAGDEQDNAFEMVWRCGTAEGGMNATKLIDQSPSPEPDRYVVNVLFELDAE